MLVIIPTITLITLIKYIYRHFLVVVPGNKRLLEKVAFFYMETILCKIIIIYLHTPFYKSFGELNNETSHAFGEMTISFLSKILLWFKGVNREPQVAKAKKIGDVGIVRNRGRTKKQFIFYACLFKSELYYTCGNKPFILSYKLNLLFLFLCCRTCFFICILTKYIVYLYHNN